ncbi:MAG: transglycosylase associated family protein, partial [Phenylobacterium sp.]|nr:transglycosylase associated family protein [Phenylobacterium sp.]
MSSHSLLAWLIIGAIAGWLAGTFVKGGGFGLLGDIVVGIIGAFIGGWLAGVLGIHV